ncbi:hypothetical protein BC831DRAFT_313595 [Entophlyctis helioformis]|nr:hypothetical protein BC831DRAFT_313595 [Entophlyctis helioformis]
MKKALEDSEKELDERKKELAELRRQLDDRKQARKQRKQLKLQQLAISDTPAHGDADGQVARGKSSMSLSGLKPSVVEGFKAEFRDPNGTLKAFCNYADMIVDDWKCGGDFIAPTGTILQASSTGKSRLITQVGRERFVFFVCLRENSEIAYPPRSKIADTIPGNPTEFTSWALGFLVVSIEYLTDVLRNDLDMTPAKWMEMQEEATFWDAIQARMEQFKNADRFQTISPTTTKPKIHVTKADNPIAMAEPSARLSSGHGTGPLSSKTCEPADMASYTSSKPRRRSGCEQLTVAMIGFQKALKKRGDPQKARLIFAFDEASRLVDQPNTTGHVTTNLDRLREVAGCLPRCSNNGVMVVFTDTNMAITNLLPVEAPASVNSLRGVEIGNIVQPFWKLCFWDVNAANPSFERVDQLIRNATSTLPVELMVNSSDLHRKIWESLRQLGRPVWPSLSEPGNFQDLMKVAVAKLCCSDRDWSRILNSAKHDNNKPAYQAAAATLFAADIIGSDVQQTSDLTARFMAICANVSPLRDRMTVIYPSDPVFAEAALTGLRYVNKSNLVWSKAGELDLSRWVRLVEILFASVKSGFMGTGDRGELVARVLLLLSMTKATWSTSPSCVLTMPVTVICFLKALFGETQKPCFWKDSKRGK